MLYPLKKAQHFCISSETQTSGANPLRCCWESGGERRGRGRRVLAPELILFIPVEISLPLLPRVPSQKFSLGNAAVFSGSCLIIISIRAGNSLKGCSGHCWDRLGNCSCFAPSQGPLGVGRTPPLVCCLVWGLWAPGVGLRAGTASCYNPNALDKAGQSFNYNESL